MAKILVVDDAVFMRKMIKDILIEDGHEVVGEGGSAKQAIELYKSLNPDLVTLDIVMPEEDGINAMAAIKKIMEFDPNAKILMVSAMGQQEIVVESIQSGAKDFVVKPFQPSNVKSAVGRLVQA